MKRNGLILIAIQIMALPGIAQIIHVPADQPSIQAGIDSATDGATVLVTDSTYYENIDFKGKAITVASHFLIDGDTSHISKTIIDGSQPNHPDSASVVRMVSGEDTTSVLCGFTVKNGKGTLFQYITGSTNLSGGGILILYSGGKIEYNIIEENQLTEPPDKECKVFGCGINARVNSNHTAIIRNNLIRNNSANGRTNAGGCGMSLNGGRLIIEGNIITGNITNSDGYAGAGGMYYNFGGYHEGVIDTVIIRNNTISGNETFGNAVNLPGILIYPGGVGIALEGWYTGMLWHPYHIELYNNIISNNTAHNGVGGGFELWDIRAIVYNNTIMNNKAKYAGKQLYQLWNTELLLFNNIIKL